MLRASGLRLAAAGVLLAGVLLAGRAYDEARMNAAAQRLGPRAVAGVRELQALIARIRGLDVARQLAEVNDHFNTRIAYAADAEVWGVPDYYATPLELLGKGRGDCEDYAAAKLFTLLAAGVPASRLSMAYVRLSRLAAASGRPAGAEEHMVLAYLPPGGGADPLVLDNVEPAIRPASQRPDLQVVHFLDVAAPRADGQLADPVIRDGKYQPVNRYSSPWNVLLARARAEGFF